MSIKKATKLAIAVYENMPRAERLQRVSLYLQRAKDDPTVQPKDYGLPDIFDARFIRFVQSLIDLQDTRSAQEKCYACGLDTGDWIAIRHSTVLGDALTATMPQASYNSMPDMFAALYKTAISGDVKAIKLWMEIHGISPSPRTIREDAQPGQMQIQGGSASTQENRRLPGGKQDKDLTDDDILKKCKEYGLEVPDYLKEKQNETSGTVEATFTATPAPSEKKEG